MRGGSGDFSMDSATHPLWPLLQPLSETQNFSPRLQTQCLCSWSDSSHLFREILSDVWASLVAQPQRIRLQCRRHRRHGFDPRVGKIPWRQVWQPTPVFIPGESHGQRSLAGNSLQGCTESDTTEATQHARLMYTVCLAFSLQWSLGLGQWVCKLQ